MRVSILALAALLAAPGLSAQQVDRTHPPSLAPPAELRLPPIQAARLPNGIGIHLVEMHEVPLVQVTVRVAGGARLDGAEPGLATFTADMMDEGAGARDGLALAAQAAYLGAELGTSADWDHVLVDLNTPRRTLDQALDLLADVVLRPTFRTADVDRERDLRLARILQQRDEPNAIANLAFGAIVYPAGYPYARPIGGDSASTVRLDSAMVRGFYQRLFRPDQVDIVVTGDITLPEAREAIASRFGTWKAGPMARLRPPVPPPAPAPRRRAVYLIDKPDAAQSVISIGGPGVDHASPDFPALEVMNTILGGSFSSRLNQDLRETKGYTYGAFSQFVYRPLPGPFIARAAVRTDVTDSSLVEFFRQIDGMRDSLVTPKELERARQYIVLGLPGEFETTREMAAKIGELLTWHLPATWFTDYIHKVEAVSTGDVRRVARKYVDPAHLDVVVVGDVGRIRPGIEALGLGPVSVRGLDGAPLTP